MIETIRQGLHAEGITVSMAKLCRWLDVPRRTAYYRPVQSAPKVNPKYADPIKALIENRLRSVTGRWRICWGSTRTRYSVCFSRWAGRSGSVQWVSGHGFRRCRRWRPRPTNAGLRIFVGSGLGGWATLALVIDGHTRALLGWCLSRRGEASTAGSALEHAPITRFGVLSRVPAPFLLRSDNGLVFTSRQYTALARSDGLRQEFITPHCPQQNGMVERVIGHSHARRAVCPSTPL